ncbi:hypothetical protein HDV00_005474 [Rhizophlyctis rosea]|nr:hypothetical protein HDV00_005474 [Rhizophlyctis rosea]
MAVTITQILCSAFIVFGHCWEIYAYIRKTNGVSMSGLVKYFQDLILCIVPAAAVTFSCSLATLFLDATMFMPLVLTQSLVECVLMYEASMLLVTHSGGSSGSSDAKTGAKSAAGTNSNVTRATTVKNSEASVEDP